MLGLFHAHSGLRYLVLLAGLVAAVYFALRLTGRGTGGRAPRVLMSVYAGLLDLQILLGVLLVAGGIFYPALFGHILMMLLAAGVAHMAAVAARKSEDARRADRIRLIGVLLSLGLIVGGILSIGRAVFGSGAPSLGG